MRKRCAIIAIIALCGPAVRGGDGRIEISQADMEGATDYQISEPGSYVLTEDITVTDPNRTGIWVMTNDITIDLNGFTFRGPGSSPSQIAVRRDDLSRSGLTIMNGTIRGWSGNISVLAGQESTIRNLRVLDSDSGIVVGTESRVSDCVVGGAIRGVGINLSSHCMVSDSVVLDTGAAGIHVASHSIVERCKVTGVLNGSSGIEISGNGCIVRRNLLGGCTGSAIEVLGFDNRIEGNTVMKLDGGSGPCGYGILVGDGKSRNLIVGNMVSSARTNYLGVATAGNIAGPRFKKPTDHPWANFSFSDPRDRYEENDTGSAAANLGVVVGSHTEPGLTIDQPTEADWYKIRVAASGTLKVSILFTHAAGDLELSLYEGDGSTYLSTAVSSTDNEELSWPAYPGSNYCIRVFSYLSAYTNSYDMVIDGPGL